MATKCLKMVSGEELLAEVTEGPSTTNVTDPCVVAIMGEGKLALIPWLPLADKPEAEINNSHIIHSYVPNQQLIDHYKQQTSNIQIATADQMPPNPPNFGN